MSDIDESQLLERIAVALENIYELLFQPTKNYKRVEEDLSLPEIISL